MRYSKLSGAVLAIAMLISSANLVHAEVVPPLPAQAAQEAQTELVPLGGVRFRKFGFHVYDANLWVADGKWSWQSLFALDIRYARHIKGKALAQKSVEEMERANAGDEAKRKKWGEEMERLFPDVKDGDRLVGVHLPGKGARFYNQDKLLGMVNDAEFSEAFFSIWLGSNSSEQSMRKKLLGLT
jgi:Chalcone isomerase-like